MADDAKGTKGANVALSGFRVDLEALIAAAEGVVAAVQQFKDEDVNDLLPVRSAAGSDDLASALDEFDDRWKRGVNNLMGDVAEIGGRLGETAMDAPAPTWTGPAPWVEAAPQGASTGFASGASIGATASGAVGASADE